MANRQRWAKGDRKRCRKSYRKTESYIRSQAERQDDWLLGR